jgi:thiosulfate/3-mercaptopyruvate sulfurtransferase
VPGAKNRPIAKDLDAQGALLPRATLEAAFLSLGATPDAQTAVMCRTGHQAAQQLFVLRFLLGHEQVMWCNGSFTQWAERAELPVELGAER